MTKNKHGGTGRGQGRKPLTTAEPTVKVAITLLPSQVEAMKELGDGNLSAGIRKAIENMNTYSRRQEIIEKIAATIYGKYMSDEDVNRANLAGWTIDIRFADGQYVSENNWSRVENIHLEPEELQQAKQLATTF